MKYKYKPLMIAACAALTLLGGGSARAEQTEARWWPPQKLPQSIVRAQFQDGLTQPVLAYQMLVQSVAGLAAKAVNAGRGTEMVWVANGNVDLNDWYARFLKLHPEIKAAGELGPWPLVERFASRGVIKGYLLYDNAESVNVATSLAGVLDGVIVNPALEPEAKAHGLKLLMDVREKTQAWCFETYKDRFNRRIVCTQDPAKPHARDLAIAQQAFTLYGQEEPLPAVMRWLEPLSPVVGWNRGDEFACTDLSSRYGHIQTSTDWCMNLPVLMAGSEKLEPHKLKEFDPQKIDWNDARSSVCFVNTDGDNVQWYQGNFFRGSEGSEYWGNPARGKIPFGWSCCFAHLAQLCPQAIDYALETRTPNDSFIEWGGGYFYPDHFGMDRPDRWELLARHTRRTWELMKQSGTRIIGFNFSQCDSANARKAYEVIVGQTDGMLGMLVFQYAPYEAGAGKTFWVKDRNGIEIPVITARYSIWEHANGRERAGTPAKIAREIRESNAAGFFTKPQPRYDWVIDHVWSYFKHAPGNDEDAENMPQENAAAAGGVRGYSPVMWCAERLPTSVRVVGPEEMIWRVRMQHDPKQTKALMSQFGK